MHKSTFIRVDGHFTAGHLQTVCTVLGGDDDGMRGLATDGKHDTLSAGRRATGKPEVLEQFGVLQLLAGQPFKLHLLDG